jgi:hypothetical protein
MMAKAWTIAGSVLFLGGIGWGGYNVATLLGHETFTDAATFDGGAVTAVDVRNSAGSVTIVGGDGDEITVTARIDSGIRPTGHRADVRGGTLVVRASCPNYGSSWCDADYTITVPRHVTVHVHAEEGVVVRSVDGAVNVDGDNGTIELEDLRGDVVAATDNGRIDATRMRSASARLSTDNGRVEATFVSPPDNVVARSDNGRITIAVPDDGEPYKVVTSTDNGSVDVAVAQDPAASRVVDARTDNGSIRVAYAG